MQHLNFEEHLVVAAAVAAVVAANRHFEGLEWGVVAVAVSFPVEIAEFAGIAGSLQIST